MIALVQSARASALIVAMHTSTMEQPLDSDTHPHHPSSYERSGVHDCHEFISTEVKRHQVFSCSFNSSRRALIRLMIQSSSPAQRIAPSWQCSSCSSASSSMHSGQEPMSSMNRRASLRAMCRVVIMVTIWRGVCLQQRPGLPSHSS